MQIYVYVSDPSKRHAIAQAIAKVLEEFGGGQVVFKDHINVEPVDRSSPEIDYD